jgi:hypothetical protein
VHGREKPVVGMNWTLILLTLAAVLLVGFALGICVAEVSLGQRERALAKSRRDEKARL